MCVCVCVRACVRACGLKAILDYIYNIMNGMESRHSSGVSHLNNYNTCTLIHDQDFVIVIE